MKTIIFASALLCAFVLSTVSLAQKEKVKFYDVHAMVKKLYRSEKKIMLDHEKVEGFMDAMVMTFPVSDTAIFDKVKIGSTGIFTLRAEGGFATVTSVKKVKTPKVLYRCPMHSNEISDKPGKCPKCGMDYEKVK